MGKKQKHETLSDLKSELYKASLPLVCLFYNGTKQGMGHDAVFFISLPFVNMEKGKVKEEEEKKKRKEEGGVLGIRPGPCTPN